MAKINRYAVANASGAGVRANMGAGATYTVPAGRTLHVTELFGHTTDAAGAASIFLTTNVGLAQDRAMLYCPTALGMQRIKFASPIEFAAATVVTLDQTQVTGLANDTFAGWVGYTK